MEHSRNRQNAHKFWILSLLLYYTLTAALITRTSISPAHFSIELCAFDIRGSLSLSLFTLHVFIRFFRTLFHWHRSHSISFDFSTFWGSQNANHFITYLLHITWTFSLLYCSSRTLMWRYLAKGEMGNPIKEMKYEKSVNWSMMPALTHRVREMVECSVFLFW